MIKILWGTDGFRIQKKLDETLKESKDAEINVFDGVNFDDLILNLITESLLTKKRVFVINNISDITKEYEEKIINALKKIPAETDVIFYEVSVSEGSQRKKSPDPIEKTKLFKFVKDTGEVTEFSKLEGVNLINFIKEKAKEEGAGISPLAAERLSAFATGDLWQLEEEIKKLALYKRPRMGEDPEPIQVSDVDLLVKENIETNIFSLMDAIAAKNKKRATELLINFFDSGENEIYLLTMIEKQFRNIAMAKFEEGVTEAALTKNAGLHPFVARKTIQQARIFEKGEIIKIYQRLMWADLKLKSGFEPRQILLRLIA